MPYASLRLAYGILFMFVIQYYSTYSVLYVLRVEQPSVVCQECTVADDVPLRAEDCTFPVVV